jgi:o-succinylbenzoate synthase
MRIDAIDLFHIAMPLLEAWRTGCSEEIRIESVVVRLVSDGVEGWAETAPHRGPLYSPEWAYGVFCTLRDWLGPMVLGQDVSSGRELQDLLRPVKGNPFAKAGLDIAWWDACAKLKGKPLWQLIGGTQQTVQAGADFGVKDTLDELLRDIDAAVNTGFKRVKLKFRPGWDLEMVRAVRSAFPDTVFHVDCNSSYTLDALPMFRELDKYRLAMIEQPLAYDDILDHAKLQADIETPICLDETIISPDRARHAIEVKACRWMNIKAGRVGGVTHAVIVHDMCQEAGIGNWIGGMLESAVGQASSLALATLPNVTYPSDIFPSRRFFTEDLAEPELVFTGRCEIDAPPRAGHGWQPNRDRLARWTRNKASLRPPAAVKAVS